MVRRQASPRCSPIGLVTCGNLDILDTRHVEQELKCAVPGYRRRAAFAQQSQAIAGLLQ
jgi:hypothetical protein